MRTEYGMLNHYEQGDILRDIGEKYKNDDNTVVKLGKPVTPSKWVSKNVTYTEVSCITISCGGGLGGSKWNEYVFRDDFDLEKKFIEVVRYSDRKNLKINTANIVAIEDFKMASMSLDNKNDNFKTGVRTLHGLIEDWQTVELI